MEAVARSHEALQEERLKVDYERQDLAMDYPHRFTYAMPITVVNNVNEVTGDLDVVNDQRYRIVEEGVLHGSGPGVLFTRIALPGAGDSLATEIICIVPTAALH